MAFKFFSERSKKKKYFRKKLFLESYLTFLFETTFKEAEGKGKNFCLHRRKDFNVSSSGEFYEKCRT